MKDAINVNKKALINQCRTIFNAEVRVNPYLAALAAFCIQRCNDAHPL